MKNLFISAGLLCLLFHPDIKAQQPSRPKVALTANLGVFTAKQVEAGAALFTTHCANCHGRDLRGTEGGNALVGVLNPTSPTTQIQFSTHPPPLD